MKFCDTIAVRDCKWMHLNPAASQRRTSLHHLIVDWISFKRDDVGLRQQMAKEERLDSIPRTDIANKIGPQRFEQRDEQGFRVRDHDF
jgi:hypothetical protein